jgi:signal peptidase I
MSVTRSSKGPPRDRLPWWRRPSAPVPLGWPFAASAALLLAPAMAGALLHWPQGTTFLLMLPGVVALIVQQQLAARARGITTWKEMPPLRLRLTIAVVLAPTLLAARLVDGSAYPLVLAAGALFVGEPVWRAVWRHHEAHTPPPAKQVDDAPPSGVVTDTADPEVEWPKLLIPVVLFALLLVFVLSFGLPLLALALLAPVVPGFYKSRRARHPEPVATTIIALALGLFAVRLFLPGLALRTVAIGSAAMEPTIAAHQRVLFDRTGIGGLGVGDIVAFHPPKDAHQRLCGPTPHRVNPGGGVCATPERRHIRGLYIRRIVAQPGDTISIVQGHVIRNGTREPDAYSRPCGALPQCNFPTPVKVPAGLWFVLGDNRRETDDSRYFGPIPRSWIIGPSIMRTWPLDRIGPL